MASNTKDLEVMFRRGIKTNLSFTSMLPTFDRKVIKAVLLVRATDFKPSEEQLVEAGIDEEFIKAIQPHLKTALESLKKKDTTNKEKGTGTLTFEFPKDTVLEDNKFDKPFIALLSRLKPEISTQPKTEMLKEKNDKPISSPSSTQEPEKGKNPKDLTKDLSIEQMTSLMEEDRQKMLGLIAHTKHKTKEEIERELQNSNSQKNSTSQNAGSSSGSGLPSLQVKAPISDRDPLSRVNASPSPSPKAAKQDKNEAELNKKGTLSTKQRLQSENDLADLHKPNISVENTQQKILEIKKISQEIHKMVEQGQKLVTQIETQFNLAKKQMERAQEYYQNLQETELLVNDNFLSKATSISEEIELLLKNSDLEPLKRKIKEVNAEYQGASKAKAVADKSFDILQMARDSAEVQHCLLLQEKAQPIPFSSKIFRIIQSPITTSIEYGLIFTTPNGTQIKDPEVTFTFQECQSDGSWNKVSRTRTLPSKVDAEFENKLLKEETPSTPNPMTPVHGRKLLTPESGDRLPPVYLAVTAPTQLQFSSPQESALNLLARNMGSASNASNATYASNASYASRSLEQTLSPLPFIRKTSRKTEDASDTQPAAKAASPLLTANSYGPANMNSLSLLFSTESRLLPRSASDKGEPRSPVNNGGNRQTRSEPGVVRTTHLV